MTAQRVGCVDLEDGWTELTSNLTAALFMDHKVISTCVLNNKQPFKLE